MEDYNRELGYGASESRFAEVRALREQRRQVREAPPRERQARGKDWSLREKPVREPYSRYEPVDPADDDDIFGERPKGSFARVLLTQAIVCALLAGGLFLVQKAAPNTYKQLRATYTQVMKTDMSAKEVWAAAKAAFSTLRDEIYVIAPYNETTADTTAQPPQSAPAEPETAGAGGLDIAMEYASKNCTAVPLATTVRPVRPVAEGLLTSGFGYRVHPISGEEGVHTGMDIAAPEGQPIYAAFYGVVRETGTGKEFGNYIILDHAGGLQTVYAHCSKILAEQGMVLRAGDVIAKVGSTGASTGPHLHFEVRLNGVRCNPLPLFAQQAYPVKGAVEEEDTRK